MEARQVLEFEFFSESGRHFNLAMTNLTNESLYCSW
jgi:hypothetical protein